MQNILITGGLGYLGGRIASHIIGENRNLNITLTTRRNLDEELSDWTQGFNLINLDLLNADKIYHTLKNMGFDLIIHLASMNSIDSMNHPGVAIDINVKGTFNLLQAAHALKVKRFIYFSTFHVYSKNHSEKINEQSPTNSTHPYAFTHKSAEDAVRYFKDYKDMKTLIFRLSNGFGCPMDLNPSLMALVFNDLCMQVIKSGTIRLNSSGKQHRDFISILDICRAVCHFVFKIPDNWGDGLFNLGGECSMSILQVAERILNLYKEKYAKEVSKVIIGSESGDICYEPICFSINKLKETGFLLKGEMDREIKRTLDLCARSQC